MDGGMQDGVALLEQACAVLVAEDPAMFTGPQAIVRGEVLLRIQQQLEVPALAAVLDVQQREAFVHAAAGSTRDWLRTQPCGDRGRLSRAKRWDRRTVVRDAVASGAVGIDSADQVCGALTKLDELGTGTAGSTGQPGTIEEGQIHGILTGAIPALLGRWLGLGLEAQEVTDTHRDRQLRLAVLLTDAAEATVLLPADRLEPVLTLLAEGLPPAHLAPGLQAILDALEPERLDSEAEQVQFRSFISITRRNGQPGWRVHGLLDEETGAAWLAQLDAYRTATQADTDRIDPATQDTPSSIHHPEPDPSPTNSPATDSPADDSPADDSAGEPAPPELPALPGLDVSVAFGQTGPGRPLQPPGLDRSGQIDKAHPVEGHPHDPARSSSQHSPDFPGNPRDPGKDNATALRYLLTDLARLPHGTLRNPDGTPVPIPAVLSIISTQAAFLGEPGAVPAELTTSHGSVTLAPETVRRIACEALLSTTRLHTDRTVLDSTGLHRHATPTQRRALQALWGTRCAVNGCTHPGQIPHHALWFSHHGRTTITNLIPLCPHHHHDIHEGHRTLRLRDDRHLTPHGLINPAPHPQRRAA